MSINTCSITGNLTRDPELRTTGGGMSILRLGVAVNERVKENDTWTDRANFFDVTVFGKRGESLSSMLHKGDKVAVSGRLRWSQWEKDGEKRSRVEIVADEIDLMKRSESGSTAERVVESLPDDEIPF